MGRSLVQKEESMYSIMMGLGLWRAGIDNDMFNMPNISIAELKASSERCFKSHMYIIFIEESNHNCNFKRNDRLYQSLLRIDNANSDNHHMRRFIVDPNIIFHLFTTIRTR
jgi:hypothetical protein